MCNVLVCIVTRLPAGATRMPVVVQAGAAGAPRAVRVVTIPRASAPTPIVQRGIFQCEK